MGYSVFRPLGVTHYVPRRAYAGYTLFSSLAGDATYLIDMQGRVVHRWRPTLPLFYGYLLDNGHLLASLQVPNPIVRFGGFTGLLVELDWDGQVLWQHEDSALHHDHARLTNGNTLVLRWAPVPAEIAHRVAGGQPGTEAEGGVMWGDELAEITSDGRTVWEWRSYAVFDPEADAICPLEYRHEWSHGNAVEELRDGTLALSFRYLNTVGILDRATGRFRWQWGRGELSHQHDPTELANGNLLVFDNGIHRVGSADRSRAVEVDPQTNEIIWQYVANPESSLYSRNISGAQRLPNGNTLLCEGDCGRLLEVTRNGEVVWEFHNPFFFDTPLGRVNRMFRAHRYGPDHPALAGRPLDPAAHAWLNRAHGLM
ncbi:MAG TPA: aryl-sulfate sulfotransferase [Chloroflexota bacterium]|jgi:outer membrane protein assembly factor BamB